MAEVAVQHHGVTSASAAYEPSLFGTYSKKIGMWLFLLSDSLTFGALLYAYSYGRISIPNWPTPFHSTSIRNRSEERRVGKECTHRWVTEHAKRRIMTKHS